ncbi:Transposase for insertion sequence element IS905, partial [Frankliniella fusca]
FLCLITLVVDAINLIRENGMRENSYYYHLGDGTHAYHVNLETGSSIYFKCVFADNKNFKCGGRAILRLGGAFKHSQPHNHNPDPDYVGQRHFRENILNEIENARFVSFHDILDEYRRDRRYSARVRCRMTMRRLRGAMWRTRMKSFPAIPHTLKELTQVLLNPQYRAKVASTIDGSGNLYAGSCTATDGSHNVLFISERMIDFLKNIKVIQSDGTFRARPLMPASAQCFVLVTPWKNCVVPLGWVLMERKSQSAYSAVFRMLKHLCPQFDPDVIITDWEYAQQKAWQDAFPNAQIQGCLWHLCRAFIKKANKLGIFRFRTALPSLTDYIRKACAICLLPVRYFKVGLGVLRDEALAEDVLLAFILREFFNYVENKWINVLPRRKWMRLFNSLERTNNLCESHNKMLRTKVGAYRPNMWAFIDALSKLEHNAHLDSMLLNEGGQARRTRPCRSVWTDNNLRAISSDLVEQVFHNRNETVSNFLRKAIRLFHGAFDAHLHNEIGRE